VLKSTVHVNYLRIRPCYQSFLVDGETQYTFLWLSTLLRLYKDDLYNKNKNQKLIKILSNKNI